jgi:hypothetical protein
VNRATKEGARKGRGEVKEEGREDSQKQNQGCWGGFDARESSVIRREEGNGSVLPIRERERVNGRGKRMNKLESKSK